MLGKEMVLKQFNYNYWANERILAGATAVTPTQFTAKQGPEQRSLHETLFHLFQVEAVWRTLCQDGRVNPTLLPQMADYPTPQSLETGWQAEAEQMRSYLAGLSEDDLREVVQVTRWDGQVLPLTRWHMLLHLNLHSMQHRSEAATMLTAYGQSPGDLDFIYVTDL